MAFNLFSDPKLRTRQDQLNAQWNSLLSVYQTCDNTPDSAFSEFITDLKAWRTFYDSESDWSSSSANATNEWQAKALDWTSRLSEWGCTGNQDGEYGTPNGIPGVKEPPPDSTSILDDAKAVVSGGADSFFGSLATVGWVATGLAILIVIGIVYLLTHVSASTPYGSVGK